MLQTERRTNHKEVLEIQGELTRKPQRIELWVQVGFKTCLYQIMTRPKISVKVLVTPGSYISI